MNITDSTIAVVFPEIIYGIHIGRAKINPGPKVLLRYQRHWVLDDSTYKFAVKSRQIGWTWMTSLALVSRKSQKRRTLRRLDFQPRRITRSLLRRRLQTLRSNHEYRSPLSRHESRR